MSRLVGPVKVGTQSLAGGAAATTICSWDLTALGGAPAADNVGIACVGLLVGKVSGGGYGRIQLVADFERNSGTVTQVGTSSVQYSAFTAAVAAALGTIDFTGTTLRLRVDDTGVVPTVSWSGYLWIYSSVY